jgi:hypothetical protein
MLIPLFQTIILLTKHNHNLQGILEKALTFFLLLSNNTDDGFSPLNFQENFVFPSTISSVIKKLGECRDALSSANTELHAFCNNDNAEISLINMKYLEKLISDLSNSVNDIISELKSLR